MRSSSEVDARKLRGGFYTPARLVHRTLDAAAAILPDYDLHVLEPSVGDGAFITGLADHPIGTRCSTLTAIEIDPVEAAAARAVAETLSIDATVVCADMLKWSRGREPMFDLVVGNPPYIRFQYLSPASRVSAVERAAALGVDLGRVSNAWVAVVLAAISMLRPGGVFSLVLPAEILSGISATAVRHALHRACDIVSIDLRPVGEFPGVQQQVAIVSGRVAPEPSARLRLQVRDAHAPTFHIHELTTRDAPNWVRYVLASPLLSQLEHSWSSVTPQRLGSIARFEVAAVTGANAYFCVNEATARDDQLQDHVQPLLPRMRAAPGLTYRSADHEQLRRTEKPAWIVAVDPQHDAEGGPPPAFIERGEHSGISQRYKCRIRTPWYCVPGVRAGDLMLSKRSHEIARIVINEAGVVTTDTIYRGSVISGDWTAPDIACGFHNSVTLAAVEIEGRSLAGGVLELVPSEIARLPVPDVKLGSYADKLDQIARSAGWSCPDGVVAATDELLMSRFGCDPEMIEAGQRAHALLQSRRLHR